MDDNNIRVCYTAVVGLTYKVNLFYTYSTYYKHNRVEELEKKNLLDFAECTIRSDDLVLST